MKFLHTNTNNYKTKMDMPKQWKKFGIIVRVRAKKKTKLNGINLYKQSLANIYRATKYFKGKKRRRRNI